MNVLVGWLILFGGISTSMDYLMPKPKYFELNFMPSTTDIFYIILYFQNKRTFFFRNIFCRQNVSLVIFLFWWRRTLFAHSGKPNKLEWMWKQQQLIGGPTIIRTSNLPIRGLAAGRSLSSHLGRECPWGLLIINNKWEVLKSSRTDQEGILFDYLIRFWG